MGDQDHLDHLPKSFFTIINLLTPHNYCLCQVAMIKGVSPSSYLESTDNFSRYLLISFLPSHAAK